MKPAIGLLAFSTALAASAFSVAQVKPGTPPPIVPAAASAPAITASLPEPSRSPAVKAAQKATEPGGTLRPAERVVPQVSIPIKQISGPVTAPIPNSASMPGGSVPGAINDGAARCLATRTAVEKAACERQMAASAPKTR